jgi:hypothetical protein
LRAVRSRWQVPDHFRAWRRALTNRFCRRDFRKAFTTRPPLEALPGKKPLIKLTYRPPDYETPLSHFTPEITPDESFFVRYHLAGIPEEILAAVMRRMSICFFVFWMAGTSAWGQAASTTDDASKGRHLAIMLCTDCHIVSPGQPYG